MVFATLFLTFSCLNPSPSVKAVSDAVRGAPLDKRFTAAHLAAIALFAVISSVLFGGRHFDSSTLAGAAAILWLCAGLAAIAFGAAAFLPPRRWLELARGTGYLWILAFAAALVAGFGGDSLRFLWPRATALTFSIVKVLLHPFGSFAFDSASSTITGGGFSANIAPACSGLEGIGLILSFTTAWLVLFRKECRFPHALILLPVGVAVLFFLNSVRIAALMLIGSAGYADIAVNGFHSQAGWIAFNAVALATCIAARENRWISVRPRAQDPPAPADFVNPTAPWVVPFVLILAAGMASRAMTGGFEWFYPLRFAAALGALWAYRRTYAALDWRIDWMGPAAGALVFAIWIALDHSAAVATPAELAAAPAGLRDGWISLRVLAATVTVPIAEELAFRGFLLRRLISAEFDAVSFRRFSWLALLASSVLFGLMHGERWLAGSLAGLIFALAVMRRGRFANAVVAHATANALLAVDVLMFHHWGLW